MLATPGSYEFHRRQPGSPWLSAGVSIAITAALFAAALLSMKAAPAWIARHAADDQPSVIVRLAPPAVHPAPVKVSPPKTAIHKPAAVAADPTVAPMSVPVGVPAPVTGTADTTSARGQTSVSPNPGAAATSTGAAPDLNSATATHSGAPVAPAGFTGRKSAPLTTDDLASLRKAKMATIIDLARAYVPTAKEAADLQFDKRRAEQSVRRATTAGDSRDVHIPTGDAVGAAGVAGGGLSSGNLVSGRLPLGILEPGPSAAKRKRDEAIEADNRAMFARLQARLVAKRAAAKADSLRRDSLARRGVVP